MAILKFRIYYEEDEGIYRDILIKHTQNFFELHECILKAYEFDSKHAATFFRSNDLWLRGREITLEKYEKHYKAPPLLMKDTVIGSEIRDTNQRFIYLYDFAKNWTFLVELILVTKEESNKTSYPSISRKEGIGPQQYGTRGLLGPRFAEMEEKYDLHESRDGFGEEGDSDFASGGAAEDDSSTEEVGGEDF